MHLCPKSLTVTRTKITYQVGPNQNFKNLLFKDTVKNMNEEATEQERDGQNLGLMKNLRMNLDYMRNSNKVTTTSPLPQKDNGQKAGQVIQEDIQMATTVKYNFTPPRIVRTKRPTVPIFGKHGKPLKPSCIADNGAKWYDDF